MSETLNLVRVPLRPNKLFAFARQRGLPQRDLDDGYLAHCVMRELWKGDAPVPFVLRHAGGAVDAWGYSRADAPALVASALALGDPPLVAAIAKLDALASKPVPRLEAGRRIGFLLRACPVVRLAGGRNGHRAGAEIDAFLARCFTLGPQAVVSREEVYCEWLTTRLRRQEITGVVPHAVRIAGISRECLVRRTHAEKRTAHRLERPDIRFEGELTVVDGQRFLDYLGHGVGRHRAFGFGALILVPPGTTYAA